MKLELLIQLSKIIINFFIFIKIEKKNYKNLEQKIYKFKVKTNFLYL